MKTKFEYIMDLFRTCFDLGSLVPDITYGDQPAGLIHIVRGNTLSLETSRRIDIRDENVIWKRWLGERIPFFFDSADQDLFAEQNGKWIIRFDIIASSFFLLSGWQEYFSENKDRYGRFEYAGSLQQRYGFIRIPVVNYYFDILRTVVEKACNIKVTPVLQQSLAPYTLCLSHDIDTCETGWLQGGFWALKRKDVGTPIRLVLKKLTGQDAWFNFSEILSVEKTFGATSTFFFIPSGREKDGIKNADYDLKRKKFKAVFRLIREHKGEVGLHGSIGSAFNIDLLAREVNFFPEPVKSNRFHFLLYDLKKSLKIMEEAGIRIDSSQGFAEHPGFRNSFCYPFRPYDISRNKAADFYEIPLALMDGSLQKYLKLPPADAFGEIEQLTEEVKKFGGVLTVLWHNTHFSSYKYPGWKELYIRLLTRCQKENAMMQSCSEVLKRFLNE